MSAIKNFKGLSSLIQRSNNVSHLCENIVFRLHHKFTVVMLVASSILLTAADFFGKPIMCITALPSHVINTYCWISSTFTIGDYNFRETGVYMAQPGVFSPESYDDEVIEKKWTYHNYYQWVVFFLFMQAALFYLPKYIWTVCEAGLMQSLCSGLNVIHKDDASSAKKKRVIAYFMERIKLHDCYAYRYWACEVLCFINVIVQIYLVDHFLGGTFLTYGTKVLEFSDLDQEERMDPMIFVFPRMTKCHFHMFGPSGTIQRKDSFCLLPLNILNEKVFVFMWFWFILMAVMIGIVLMYRLVLLFMPAIRPKLLYAQTKSVPLEALEVLAQKTSVGDWWVLYQLSHVINPSIYKDIVSTLSKEIETTASNAGCSNGGGYGGKTYPSIPNGGSAPALYSSSAV